MKGFSVPISVDQLLGRYRGNGLTIVHYKSILAYSTLGCLVRNESHGLYVSFKLLKRNGPMFLLPKGAWFSKYLVVNLAHIDMAWQGIVG
jgi:hypothetical protein